MTQRADVAVMMWNDEKIGKLKKLWQEGLTTGEIGKRLGVSKNAVVGKAHRLGLKGRPSPIKRAEGTTPATASAASSVSATPASPAAPASSKKQVAKVFTLIDLNSNTCRWPIGDPKHEDFHFCGKGVYPGKPYCLDHCAQAYVGSNKPRTEQAA